MMTKTQNTSQSMEDAIAEALAAVDAADTEQPAVENGRPVVNIEPHVVAAPPVEVAAPAPAAAPVIAADGDELADALRKLDEMKARHMRLMADFDNYRKRIQRDQKTQRLYASEGVMRDLLGVVDNMQRALSASTDGDAQGGLREGVTMILNQLLAMMGRHGVSPFDSIGQPFDPELHEAVARQPHSEHAEDIVCEEMQRGYVLHERLLRAATVIVSAGKLDTALENASNGVGASEA